MKKECPYHDQDGLDVCNCKRTDKIKEDEWWSPLAIPSNETCRGHRYVDYDHIPKIIAEADKRARAIPVGVSEWRVYGEKRGYWEFFAKQERDRIKSLLLANGHGGGNWRRIIEQL